MNEPLVTIFTQAYNVENYIRQCVESVLKQTCGNFEWILIDNGSTDTTREIIREYAKNDKRIKAVRVEKNSKGFFYDMIVAFGRGKYVARLDSDDFWDSRYLEILVNEMEDSGADLVCCAALVLDEINNKEYYREPSRGDRFVTRESFAEQYCEIEININTYWAKLMKRDLVIKVCDANWELFRKGGWCGDTIFMYSYLNECHTIKFLKDVLFFYRIHKKNMSKTMMDLQSLDSCFRAFDIKKNLLLKFHAWNEKNRDKVYGAFWGSIDTFFRNIIQNDKWDNRNKIEKMGQIFSDARVLKLRREYMPDNAWMILKTHIAWCYVNMQEECENAFLKMLIVLEPEIFSEITQEQYRFLLSEKILLSLIIMGEKEEVLQYLQKQRMEDVGGYDEIYDMLITFRSNIE